MKIYNQSPRRAHIEINEKHYIIRHDAVSGDVLVYIGNASGNIEDFLEIASGFSSVDDAIKNFGGI